MSRLEVILMCTLTVSAIFNIFVFVYARGALARLLFVSEELGDLQQMVDSFAKHVKSVYELEAFYGDQTLQHLLQHAVSFNEYLGTFESIYSLTEEEGPITDEEEEEVDLDDRETDKDKEATA